MSLKVAEPALDLGVARTQTVRVLGEKAVKPNLGDEKNKSCTPSHSPRYSANGLGVITPKNNIEWLSSSVCFSTMEHKYEYYLPLPAVASIALDY